MSLKIRAAQQQDAEAMARILNEIIRIGGTTSHRSPFDESEIIDNFISRRLGISCFLATDGSKLLGFQALEWADPTWPGDDRLPEDWAIIATYVDPLAHRRGAGRKLFAKTAEAAKMTRVNFIDATIRKENTTGQSFYQALGFRDYRIGGETISKCI